MDAIETLHRHSPETSEFWHQLKAGKFMLRGCRSCGKVHWYPRVICPFCASEETEWREGSGRGEIYTYSVMRRAKVPYAIAFVTLEEGPSMMTNIVDCDFDAIRIGQKVELAIRAREDGLPLPLFRPVG